MRLPYGLLAVWVLMVSMTISAQQDVPRELKSRRAWEWADAERLAERFDPARMRERRERSRHAGAHNSDVVVVEGASNPELFLPFELFDSVVSDLAAEEHRRLTRVEQLRAAGFDEQTFWSDLAFEAQPYTERRRHMGELRSEDRVNRPRSPERQVAIEALIPVLCRSRLDALEAVRNHFGRERFDRFLYTTVAGRMSATGSGAPEDRVQFEYEAGGCRRRLSRSPHAASWPCIFSAPTSTAPISGGTV